MHEFGLSASILDAVERRAAGRTVGAVRVRVGTLLRVDEPALAQAFEMVGQGSVAEGARLELVVTPAEVACTSCGVSTTADELVLLCPACGTPALRVTAGEDLLLESITLIEREEAHVPGHPG